MLLIKAKGGLGNRLLSAATGIAYAQATDRKWQLDWSDGLYAPIGINAVELLFPALSQHNFSAQKWNKASVNPRIWDGLIEAPIRQIISQNYPTKHSNPLIYRQLSAPLNNECAKDEIEIFWSYTSKYGRIKRFLSASQRSLGRDRVLGQVLKSQFCPSSDVIKNVEGLVADHKTNILGVHIRYTDLKIPIEKLIDCVKTQLKQFDYQAIYLASDSLKAQDKFIREFDNVITHAKRYSENETQLHKVSSSEQTISDAKSALTDMFALAECSGLVYCSRSTFAETSRLIGNIHAERVVDVDRYNLSIRLKRSIQEYL